MKWYKRLDVIALAFVLVLAAIVAGATLLLVNLFGEDVSGPPAVVTPMSTGERLESISDGLFPSSESLVMEENGWMTYTNSTYGYRISFPESVYDLRVSKDESMASFLRKERHEEEVAMVRISALSKWRPEVFSVDTSIEENARNVFWDWAVGSTTRDSIAAGLTIGEFAGAEAAFFTYDQKYRVLKHNGEVILVSTYGSGATESQDYEVFVESFELLE